MIKLFGRFMRLKKKVTFKKDANFKILLQLFLLCGAFILLVMIACTGKLPNSSSLVDLYWIRADDLSGTSAKVYWSYWGMTYNYDDGTGYHDFSIYAGCPFSPYDNYSKRVLGSSAVTMPTDFITRRNLYFYLGRFVFPFILLCLIFIGFSIVFTALTKFIPPGFVKLTNILITVSLLFDALAICFQTAIIGSGNNAFQKANVGSNVGSSLLGIAWASVAVLFILFMQTFWSVFSKRPKIPQMNGVQKFGRAFMEEFQEEKVAKKEVKDPKKEEKKAEAKLEEKKAELKLEEKRVEEKKAEVKLEQKKAEVKTEEKKLSDAKKEEKKVEKK